MTRPIIIILTFLLLFSCSTSSDSETKIQEIYYRELSPQSYGTYKTELLIILSNGQGFRFLDDRPSSLAEPITSEKINLLSQNEFNPPLGPGVSKIQKINVDYTNFMLVINDPFAYNQILKCHYNKDSKELKFKKYIIDHGDTLNILEPNSDTSGVYYFKSGSAGGSFVDLNFPNPDKISKRDITQEQIRQKTTLPYDQEIANYVQFEKYPVNASQFDNYKNNSFALRLIERGPNGSGGEYGVSIEIIDDFVFLNFASEGGKEITFQYNRPLLKVELQEITDAINISKLENDGMSFSRGINGYQCGRTQLVLKYGQKTIAGGDLYPLTISGSLARSSNDIQKILKDCRAHSSTLKGDYDLVFTSIKKTFKQLDSLYRCLNPNAN